MTINLTGACCIDDYSAKALGADLLIHYGHSCLIPIDQTTNVQQVLYIFVDIKIDIRHCIDCIQASIESNKKIALVSTIQFVGTLEPIANELRKADYHVKIPQSRPLSPGEVNLIITDMNSQFIKMNLILSYRFWVVLRQKLIVPMFLSMLGTVVFTWRLR